MNKQQFLLGTAAGVALVMGMRSIEPRRPWWYPLTPSQARVSELVAAGLSNHEIGRTLAINQQTIAYHVGAVLRKLDLHGRSEIGDWVLTHRPPGDLKRTAVTYSYFPLSPKEAGLIAAGQSNAAIAKHFGRMERKIEVHILALTKLDSRKRSEIGEWIRARRPAQDSRSG